MRPRRSVGYIFRRTLLWGIFFGACITFAWTLTGALWFSPGSDIDVPGYVPPTSNALSKPTRLQIPSLNIDASVQHVGITTSGAMGIPSNFSDVAWYKYGPVPGQYGSAVIDGHFDNGLGLPGVFKDLAEIKQGDDVFVQTSSGSLLRFMVTRVATYPYTDVPTAEVFGLDDRARLHLITCSGRWVRSDKTYNERVVVYTIFVDETTKNNAIRSH